MHGKYNTEWKEQHAMMDANKLSMALENMKAYLFPTFTPPTLFDTSSSPFCFIYNNVIILVGDDIWMFLIIGDNVHMIMHKSSSE